LRVAYYVSYARNMDYAARDIDARLAFTGWL
jgi:hypothetical protein